MSFPNRVKGVPQGVLGDSGDFTRSERTSSGELNGQSGSRTRPQLPPLRSTPAQGARRSGGTSQSAASPARVLVVEPVPVLRTIITRAFADRGHSVTTVGSLDEMRRLMPSFDPHVVVCELTLPDGAGDTACRRLKASANKLRPIVLMSGVPELELQRRSMQAGADRFHCKSHGLSELIELVEELTEEILF